MRVGLIGIGNMGRPMALNLLRQGFQLTVYNRSKPRMAEVLQAGAREAASPKDVAKNSDFVLTSLPLPATVEEVVLGDEGSLAGSKPGDIFIDLSTVDPETSKRVASAVAKKGVHYLDAPVTGGTTGAAAATLTIMAGGEKEAFELSLPVLEALGKSIFHVGPVGSGSIVKLVNQMLVGVTNGIVAEAMVLGTKAGVEPRLMYEVLSTGFAGSAILNRAVPNFMLRGNFEPGFAIDLLYKDLQLASQLGKELTVRLLLTNLAQQVFEEARAQGLGAKDMSAAVLPLERLSAVEVRAPEKTS
ncbi:MAG: NAD(P)-dependent oxidoreductase [Chloroflexi bacterium]|nr:NAD(P)-dependent oxidoreductase [Chloroflexota bacterium]